MRIKIFFKIRTCFGIKHRKWKSNSNQNIKAHVQTCISLCEFQKFTPFYWDSEAECVRVSESGRKAKKCAVFAVHISLIVGMLYETLSNVETHKNAYQFTTLVRIFYLVAFGAGAIYQDEVWSDSHGFSSLLNGIMQNFKKLGAGNLEYYYVMKTLTGLKIAMLATIPSVLTWFLVFPETPRFHHLQRELPVYGDKGCRNNVASMGFLLLCQSWLYNHLYLGMLISSLNSKIQGSLNGMSKELLQVWNETSDKRMRKEERKIIGTMKEIRIRFGTSNFYVRNTCLVIGGFQIENIVN
ncbi:unnamed protein product [Orchesella dallaii]|uniref:Uncharacterized protein n=1 Tax=Orchesella dallaii TaxID=48710 RepID=A0ABP1PUR8_9HEXA